MNERFAASLAPALSYYAALSPAAGFQGRCAMSIPADIEGKRVLDVCCRKGKGAFALADAVGPSGYVIGVDPDTDNVAAACAAAPKNHRAGSSWERHLRFSLCDPRKPFPGLHRRCIVRPGLYQQRFESCVVVARRVGRIRPGVGARGKALGRAGRVRRG